MQIKNKNVTKQKHKIDKKQILTLAKNIKAKHKTKLTKSDH